MKKINVMHCIAAQCILSFAIVFAIAYLLDSGNTELLSAMPFFPEMDHIDFFGSISGGIGWCICLLIPNFIGTILTMSIAKIIDMDFPEYADIPAVVAALLLLATIILSIIPFYFYAYIKTGVEIASLGILGGFALFFIAISRFFIIIIL